MFAGGWMRDRSVPWRPTYPSRALLATLLLFPICYRDNTRSPNMVGQDTTSAFAGATA